MNMFESVVANIAANVPKPDREIQDENGIWKCAICGDETRCTTLVCGNPVEVRCICSCKKAVLAENKRREQKSKIEDRKRDCFSQFSMWKWTFENDDQQDPNLSKKMQKYANNFDKYLKESRGLVLYGTVGTGKSYYAAAIANRIIDNGYFAKMTNFAELTNALSIHGIDKNEYIKNLNHYDLLIIDDLGAERNSEFMQELVFSVVDSRCRSGKPMIITTNLTAEELKKPGSVGRSRIYDRLFGCCFPIQVSGTSRRKKKLRDSFEQMSRELDL